MVVALRESSPSSLAVPMYVPDVPAVTDAVERSLAASGEHARPAAASAGLDPDDPRLRAAFERAVRQAVEQAMETAFEAFREELRGGGA